MSAFQPDFSKIKTVAFKALETLKELWPTGASSTAHITVDNAMDELTRITEAYLRNSYPRYYAPDRLLLTFQDSIRREGLSRKIAEPAFRRQLEQSVYRVMNGTAPAEIHLHYAVGGDTVGFSTTPAGTSRIVLVFDGQQHALPAGVRRGNVGRGDVRKRDPHARNHILLPEDHRLGRDAFSVEQSFAGDQWSLIVDREASKGVFIVREKLKIFPQRRRVPLLHGDEIVLADSFTILVRIEP